MVTAWQEKVTIMVSAEAGVFGCWYWQPCSEGSVEAADGFSLGVPPTVKAKAGSGLVSECTTS
jgi:hypothetical protein